MRRDTREFDYHRGSQTGYPARKKSRFTPSSANHDSFNSSAALQLIASETNIHIGEQMIRSSPSLAELRFSRHGKPDWLWDRAARGCSKLNVWALKLFSAALPNEEFSAASVPEEVLRMKCPRPLRPENSWVFRKVGGRVYDDLKEASLQGISDRPANLPSFDGLMTSRRSIVVNGVSSIAQIEERYGPLLEHSQISSSNWIALPKNPVPDLNSEDQYLLPQDDATPPVIEILNAMPLKQTNVDYVSHIRTLCVELGEEPSRIWKKTGSAACPYVIPRIFVQLMNSAKTLELAKRLGEKSIQGRQLIIAINHTPDLQ